MSHTKGEWKVAEVEEARMTCVYTEETNIALLVHQKDAQLIASAPELLELLKRIQDFKSIHHRFPGGETILMELIDKLVNKAEGK